MQKLTLKEMQDLAEKHSGKCLSKRYITSQNKLKWQCKNKHVWMALPSSVKQGFWCIKCFADKRRHSISKMQKIAASRGGVCLSKKYINTKTSLRWECEKGHTWDALPSAIKRGSWCQRCAGKAKHSIQEMCALARSRDGRCLSAEYNGAHTKLQWECKFKHKWWAKPNGITTGHWCPECSVYRMEKVVRSIFQQLFNKPFPRARPKWLTSPTGKPLELDGYLQDRKVAFEYNGKQHYAYVKRFQTRFGTLNKRRNYDTIKERKCEEHGIRLIVIPYTIKTKDLVEYIRRECQRKGIKLAAQKVDLDIGSREVYATDAIKELNLLAKQRGGRCLSKSYINSETSLTWSCSAGHKWQAPAWTIRGGKWCTKCLKLAKNKIRASKALGLLRKFAESRGGKCLAKDYANNQTPVLWECIHKHQWYASPGNVVSKGSWCKKCYWESVRHGH